MILELHDAEPDSLVARIGAGGALHHDYQAEQWVLETYALESARDARPGRWVVLWVLTDEHGVRARWERATGDPQCPRLVLAAPRYTGDWKVGT